jgi:hypothetical protein
LAPETSVSIWVRSRSIPLRSTGRPTAGVDDAGVDDTLCETGVVAPVFDALQLVAVISPITATAASRRADLPLFMVPPSKAGAVEIMFGAVRALWMKRG